MNLIESVEKYKDELNKQREIANKVKEHERNIIEYLSDLILSQKYSFKDITYTNGLLGTEGKLYYPILDVPKGYTISSDRKTCDRLLGEYEEDITILKYNLVQNETREVISIEERGHIDNVREVCSQMECLGVKISLPAEYRNNVNCIQVVTQVNITISIREEKFNLQKSYNISKEIYQQVFGKVTISYSDLFKKFNKVISQLEASNSERTKIMKELIEKYSEGDTEIFNKVYNNECGLYEYNKKGINICIRKRKRKTTQRILLLYELKGNTIEVNFEIEEVEFIIATKTNGEYEIKDNIHIVKEIEQSLLDKKILPILKEIINVKM